jgi:transketolase
LGATHHSLHDFAALRAIHNIIIVAPADNFETREAVRAAAASPHPVYLRFGKAPLAHLHAPGASFALGQSITLAEGNDATLIATGEAVQTAWLASHMLAQAGVRCRVISMHTVKPLDAEAVLRAARETGAVMTVEEHSLCGGLGEACAATLMQAGARVPFRIVGFPDEYMVSGSQAQLFDHYGLSPAKLAATVQALRVGAFI